MSDKLTHTNYGLTEEKLSLLLSKCLKPEEINGDDKVREQRVDELVNWFARLAAGNANPKWAVQHAMELAHYIATQGVNRHINLRQVVQRSWEQGVAASESDRSIMRRHGLDKIDDSDLKTRLEAAEAQIELLTVAVMQNKHPG